MVLDEKTIEEILKGDDLAKVENEISRLTKRSVNRDYLIFTIGIIRRDVTNSGLMHGFFNNEFLSHCKD
jgi:hypothetical protein